MKKDLLLIILLMSIGLTLLPFVSFGQKHIAAGEKVVDNIPLISTDNNRLISALSGPGKELSRPQASITPLKISLDGRMNEMEWKQAELMKIFEEGSSKNSSVRVLYDSTHIYLYWIVNEPERITSRMRSHDSVITGEDYVQVNLAPLLPDSIIYGRDYYYSIAVNPHGIVWDAYYDPYQKGYYFSSWDSDVEVTTHRSGDKWRAEMQIPFSEMDILSDPGWRWELEFVHHRIDKQGKTYKSSAKNRLTVKQGFMVRRPSLVQYYWTRPGFLSEIKPPKPKILRESTSASHFSRLPRKDQGMDNTLWSKAQSIKIENDDRFGTRLDSNTAQAQIGFANGHICFNMKSVGGSVHYGKSELALGEGMKAQMKGVNGVYMNSAFFATESFWIIIQPRSSKKDIVHQPYYIILVNNFGEIYGSAYNQFGQPDRAWSPKATVDVYNTSTGWGAEISISLASFDLPIYSAENWGLNLFRNRKYGEDKSQLQAWVYTRYDFLNPKTMGVLTEVPEQNISLVRQSIKGDIKDMRQSIKSLSSRYQSQISDLMNRLNSLSLDSRKELASANQQLSKIDQQLGILEARMEYNTSPHPTDSGYALKDVQFIGEFGWSVGAMGTILRSEDGGKTWKKIDINSTADFERVEFINKNKGWAVGGKVRMAQSNEQMRHDKMGGYAYIYHTSDGGKTWQIQYGMRGRYLFGVDFINNKIGYACGERGIILKTEDGGNHWYTLATSGTNEWLYDIEFRTSNIGFAVGESGIVLKTNNGGNTWNELDVRADREFYGFHPHFRDITFSGSTGCIVGQNGSILISHNGGKEWNPSATAVAPNIREYLDFWRVHFTSPSEGYVVGRLGTRIMVTRDGGRSWALKPVENHEWLRGVWAQGNGKVICVGEREKILFSSDRGSNWKMQHGNLPKVDIMILMAHGDDAMIFLNSLFTYYGINKNKDIVSIEVMRDDHPIEYDGEIYNLEHRRAVRMAGIRTATNFDEFETGNAEADFYHYLKRLWEGEKNVVRHMVAAIRTYKPDIVFIHEPVYGDYNKPGHKLSGRAGIQAFETAGGNSDHWPHLTRIGLEPWQPKKLYCAAGQSYPETLDISHLQDIPLKGVEDMTVHQWANYVLRNFQSQGIHYEELYPISLIKSNVSVPAQEQTIFDGLK